MVEAFYDALNHYPEHVFSEEGRGKVVLTIRAMLEMEGSAKVRNGVPRCGRRYWRAGECILRPSHPDQETTRKATVDEKCKSRKKSAIQA